MSNEDVGKVMADIIKSIAEDPMCYPQLVNDPFEMGYTWVQRLSAHIHFCIDDPMVDELDAMVIY